MPEIPFSALSDAIKDHEPCFSPGARLVIGAIPDPFVPPNLVYTLPRAPRVATSATARNSAILANLPPSPFSAEVLFIRAAAAVGKSTLANYLSGSMRIPLLDLARIPVSTGTLKALLLDVTEPDHPLDYFHARRLPVIVDALDEGRLRSGETGFESFLQTTGELLLENRVVTNRPKLIFFGRYESTLLAELGLQLAGEEITSSILEVGFFGEEGARKLIEAYADATAPQNSPYRQHPGPVRHVIEAYFEAIESALGCGEEQLWATDHGRAFAGYAPVLAAVGSLLAELDNFMDVANKLRDAGAREAWGVIDAVLYQIIDREQHKLCEKLVGQLAVPMPDEAYDLEEQLTLLCQHVHQQPLVGSGRVNLPAPDKNKYDAMAQQYVPEHPFIRHQEFGNAVLGSVVIAYGITRDLLRSVDLERTATLSVQPFIWRAIATHLDTNSLVDGNYVGYILNSFWNDPIRLNRRVVIQSVGPDEAQIRVPTNDHEYVDFAAIVPISLYAQVRDCDVDLEGLVRLVGHGPRGPATAFVRGETTIICSQIDIVADTIRFDGSIWLESDAVSSRPGLKIFINGAKVGWGGQFKDVYPWKGYSSTLPSPYEVQEADELTALVKDCETRLPSGVTVTLERDFSASPDDPHMRWVSRRHPETFPALVDILVRHGAASSQAVPAAGQGKVRVRFDFKWSDLLQAVRQPEQERWRAIIRDA